MVRDISQHRAACLVQVWVPTQDENYDTVLVTYDSTRMKNLPYACAGQVAQLEQFRNASCRFAFGGMPEEKKKQENKQIIAGLPGRVWQKGLPESSPNVKLYKHSEYPRSNAAGVCDVRGSVAIPLYFTAEQQQQNVVQAVVEVVQLCEELYPTDLIDKACDCIGRLGLESRGRSVKIERGVSQMADTAAFGADAINLLRRVAGVHHLPLAQVWGKYGDVLVTADLPFAITQHHVWAYRMACCQRPLALAEGLVGQVATRGKSTWCPDVKQVPYASFPFKHWAQMLGLCGMCVIVVKSTLTGESFYVELALPLGMYGKEEQVQLLRDLSETFDEFQLGCDHVTVESSFLDRTAYRPPALPAPEALPGKMLLDLLQDVAVPGPLDGPLDDPPVIEELGNAGPLPGAPGAMPRMGVHLPMHPHTQAGAGAGLGHAAQHQPVQAPGAARAAPPLMKMEPGGTKSKNLTLQDLQPYFGMTLKDAAAELNMGATTLKRVCRKFGISRWPSRKLKMIDRLNKEKLQSMKMLGLVPDDQQAGPQAYL